MHVVKGAQISLEKYGLICASHAHYRQQVTVLKKVDELVTGVGMCTYLIQDSGIDLDIVLYKGDCLIHQVPGD